jgi:hypothetical protein
MRDPEEAWTRTGLTLDGKDIWERTFPAHGQQPEILVTILFDAAAGQSQLLYATRLTAATRVARLPSEVRRQAEAFARRLAAGTR